MLYKQVVDFTRISDNIIGYEQVDPSCNKDGMHVPKHNNRTPNHLIHSLRSGWLQIQIFGTSDQFSLGECVFYCPGWDYHCVLVVQSRYDYGTAGCGVLYSIQTQLNGWCDSYELKTVLCGHRCCIQCLIGNWPNIYVHTIIIYY